MRHVNSFAMMFMVSDKRKLKEFSNFAPKIRFKKTEFGGKGRDECDVSVTRKVFSLCPITSLAMLTQGFKMEVHRPVGDIAVCSHLV